LPRLAFRFTSCRYTALLERGALFEVKRREDAPFARDGCSAAVAAQRRPIFVWCCVEQGALFWAKHEDVALHGAHAALHEELGIAAVGDDDDLPAVQRHVRKAKRVARSVRTFLLKHWRGDGEDEGEYEGEEETSEDGDSSRDSEQLPARPLGWSESDEEGDDEDGEEEAGAAKRSIIGKSHRMVKMHLAVRRMKRQFFALKDASFVSAVRPTTASTQMAAARALRREKLKVIARASGLGAVATAFAKVAKRRSNSHDAADPSDALNPTVAARRDAREIFDEFDKDGSGAVDLAELQDLACVKTRALAHLSHSPIQRRSVRKPHWQLSPRYPTYIFFNNDPASTRAQVRVGRSAERCPGRSHDVNARH
jgi:hypothetical protein